jgi:nicotinamidase-related amidase
MSNTVTSTGNRRRRGVWGAADCALLLIDYQQNVLEQVFEQDRRLVELNARALAKAALNFKIPVVLSTVGVEMGINEPTLASLKAALPNVKEIDRSNMNSWEDPAFLDAVKATGRKRLVMGGIVTSVCLAYPAVDALADGYEVMFIEDAVADQYLELHDTAVLRLAHAGAIPNNTIAMIAEWLRDWKSPLADSARKIIVPYMEEMAALRRGPEYHEPKGPGARPPKTTNTREGTYSAP